MTQNREQIYETFKKMDDNLSVIDFQYTMESEIWVNQFDSDFWKG